MNPNLLTLTAPDKGGLTNLNLRGGLAFSFSLLGAPWPSLQEAPNLVIPSKCQHTSLPRRLPACLKVPFVLISTGDKCVGISQGPLQGQAEAFSFQHSLYTLSMLPPQASAFSGVPAIKCVCVSVCA